MIFEQTATKATITTENTRKAFHHSWQNNTRNYIVYYYSGIFSTNFEPHFGCGEPNSNLIVNNLLCWSQVVCILLSIFFESLCPCSAHRFH